jgi:putative transposase
MPRLARVICLGLPHHITQRGNAQQFILQSDEGRTVYLDLLRKSVELHEIEIIGYCVMSNHVHLVAIPNQADAMGLALKWTHGRFASYWNATHSSSGLVWQGRYYSCPLDEEHLWEALRYWELNPVRACMVARAEDWGWSSAAVHCGLKIAESWLETELRRNRWCVASWRNFLDAGESPAKLVAIRHSTHTGRPLGSADFLCAVEKQTKRSLVLQKPGPQPKPMQARSQGTFSIER